MTGLTVLSTHDPRLRAQILDTPTGVRVDLWAGIQVTRRTFDLPFHLVLDAVEDLLNANPGEPR